MPIPAYIIDHIQSEQRDRNNSIFDELHIQPDEGISGTTQKKEHTDSASRRGVDEVDFFV
ncbi:MAG: hypothetical protein JXX29_09065 [Deltaproteobacteria bacterium]|nr:hypothetical protein [Deltaproteobacteria bacterium]MBN2671812.1 hypothetical protein [Deltaproteobacteria bacterium]